MLSLSFLSPEESKQLEKFLKGDISSLVKDRDIFDVSPAGKTIALPALFSPGWGSNPHVAENFIQSLAKKRRVLSLFPRLANKQHPPKHTPLVMKVERALSLIEILEKKKIAKVDAIGHSQGALNLVIAAYLFPEKFRHIILAAPAGLRKEDTFSDLARRFVVLEGLENLKQLINKQLYRKNILRSVKEIARYFFSHPLLAIQEADTVSSLNTAALLQNIRGKGVRVSMVFFRDDRVFPWTKASKYISRNDVDNLHILDGGHNELIYGKHVYSFMEKLLEE